MSLIWITPPHQKWYIRKGGGKHSCNGSNNNLSSLLKPMERVEDKMDRMEERLGLLEKSCYAIRATVEKTDTRTIELMKFGKVCLSYFVLPFD